MKPSALAIIIVLLLLAAWPAAAQQTPAAEKIGQVSFPISCDPGSHRHRA